MNQQPTIPRDQHAKQWMAFVRFLETHKPGDTITAETLQRLKQAVYPYQERVSA